MLPFPYWRLSGYYFFYFAFIGVFSPYFGLYLQSLSLSAWDISVLLTQMQVMRFAAPFFWSALSDRTGRRIWIIRVTGLATLVVFCAFFSASHFSNLLLILSAQAFFWVAALPLMETLTFDHLREEPARYSRVRMWGSIGFIAAVLGTGILLDRHSPASLLWVCVFALTGVVLCSLAIPDVILRHGQEGVTPLGRIVGRADVRALLAACFAMAAAHGVLNVFYSIFLADHGYDKSLIGGLWTLGVLAEIAVFFYMARMMRHFGLRPILMACLGAAVVRFAAIGVAVDHLAVLILAQLLHGLTFGAFHAAAITAINRWFPGSTCSRGQALYSSLSFGAGGALGGLACGWAWDHLGSLAAFMLGSMFALMGLIFVSKWIFDQEDVSGKQGKSVSDISRG